MKNEKELKKIKSGRPHGSLSKFPPKPPVTLFQMRFPVPQTEYLRSITTNNPVRRFTPKEIFLDLIYILQIYQEKDPSIMCKFLGESFMQKYYPILWDELKQKEK